LNIPDPYSFERRLVSKLKCDTLKCDILASKLAFSNSTCAATTRRRTTSFSLNPKQTWLKATALYNKNGEKTMVGALYKLNPVDPQA
jgi:hypothetical protein